MKKIYIDLETTGTNPQTNGIIQIAGFVQINGERKEQFNFNVKPFEDQIIEAQALAVTGKTAEEIAAYPTPRAVFGQLMAIICKYVDKYNKADKFIFVAYNATFDFDFLRTFFTRNGEGYFGSYFHFPPVCIMQAAAFKLQEQRSGMLNFKLATVAEKMGIDTSKIDFHDAMADIEVTKLIEELL